LGGRRSPSKISTFIVCRRLIKTSACTTRHRLSSISHPITLIDPITLLLTLILTLIIPHFSSLIPHPNLAHKASALILLMEQAGITPNPEPRVKPGQGHRDKKPTRSARSRYAKKGENHGGRSRGDSTDSGATSPGSSAPSTERSLNSSALISERSLNSTNPFRTPGEQSHSAYSTEDPTPMSRSAYSTEDPTPMTRSAYSTEDPSPVSSVNTSQNTTPRVGRGLGGGLGGGLGSIIGGIIGGGLGGGISTGQALPDHNQTEEAILNLT